MLTVIAFVAGVIVGAVFNRWFAKQAADAQVRVADEIKKVAP